MPKINIDRLDEVAKPLKELRLSVVGKFSAIKCKPSFLVSMPSADSTVNEFTPEWSDLFSEIHRLIMAGNTLALYIRTTFSNPNLEIDRKYSYEIIRFYIQIINPIQMLANKISVLVKENSLDAALRAALLEEVIPLYLLNEKLLSYIVSNFFYESRRLRAAKAMDAHEQMNIIEQQNNITVGYTVYNSANYPQLLEDTLFSLAHSYEMLGKLHTAENYYTRSESLLEEMIASQSRSQADNRFEVKRNDTYGKLAFLNFKLNRIHTSREYLEKCLELSTLIIQRDGVESSYKIYSEGIVRLYIPMILYYFQQNKYDQAYTLTLSASNYLAGYFSSSNNPVIKTNTIEQLLTIRSKITQSYQSTITNWQSALFAEKIDLQFIDSSCHLSFKDDQLFAQLPALLLREYKLKKSKNQVVIADVYAFPPHKLYQLFNQLNQLAYTPPQRQAKSSSRNKADANYPLYQPEAEDQITSTSTSTQTLEHDGIPQRLTPKIKTRGTEIVPPITPKAKNSALTTDDIEFSDSSVKPTESLPLHRLHSRTLANGPYAFTRRSIIRTFFPQSPEVADKAESILEVGNIVGRFGAQGVKFSRKENSEYPYKIKFLGQTYGDYRILGKVIGVIHEETGDVPVIEFNHCVRKAH